MKYQHYKYFHNLYKHGIVLLFLRFYTVFFRQRMFTFYWLFSSKNVHVLWSHYIKNKSQFCPFLIVRDYHSLKAYCPLPSPPSRWKKMTQVRLAIINIAGNWFKCWQTLSIFENLGQCLYEKSLTFWKLTFFEWLSMLEESVTIL